MTVTVREPSDPRTHIQVRAQYRVLHVIPSLGLGGSERLLLDLVRVLSADRAYELKLVVLRGQESVYEGHRLPIEPVFLNYTGHLRDPLATWNCMHRLRAVIQDFGPDLVHSYLWLADLLTACALWSCHAKPAHVSHILDCRLWLESRQFRARARRWLTRWLLRSSRARFLAVSEAAKQFACRNLGFPQQDVIVVHNSIDVTSYAGVAIDEPQEQTIPVVGTASRLVAEKGHSFLLQAAAQLQRRRVPFRLLITGDGPYKEELIQQAADLQLGDSVHFIGRVRDMPMFYRGLNVFVVPSIDSEGLPSTILEAMAAGQPVVATRVGGAAEAVRDGVEGLLVPPQDPRALADALERLLRDSTMRRQMGTCGRNRALAEFTIEQMGRKVAEVYAAILARTHG